MKRALELEDDKMIKKWPPQENHLAAHCGVVRSDGHLVARRRCNKWPAHILLTQQFNTLAAIYGDRMCHILDNWMTFPPRFIMSSPKFWTHIYLVISTLCFFLNWGRESIDNEECRFWTVAHGSLWQHKTPKPAGNQQPHKHCFYFIISYLASQQLALCPLF